LPAIGSTCGEIPDVGASLLWVNQHVEEGHYDVAIVDCAPTAETLWLLSIPSRT